jgi:hypothetical protein
MGGSGGLVDVVFEVVDVVFEAVDVVVVVVVGGGVVDVVVVMGMVDGVVLDEEEESAVAGVAASTQLSPPLSDITAQLQEREAFQRQARPHVVTRHFVLQTQLASLKSLLSRDALRN